MTAHKHARLTGTDLARIIKNNYNAGHARNLVRALEAILQEARAPMTGPLPVSFTGDVEAFHDMINHCDYIAAVQNDVKTANTRRSYLKVLAKNATAVTEQLGIKADGTKDARSLAEVIRGWLAETGRKLVSFGDDRKWLASLLARGETTIYPETREKLLNLLGRTDEADQRLLQRFTIERKVQPYTYKIATAVDDDEGEDSQLDFRRLEELPPSVLHDVNLLCKWRRNELTSDKTFPVVRKPWEKTHRTEEFVSEGMLRNFMREYFRIVTNRVETPNGVKNPIGCGIALEAASFFHLFSHSCLSTWIAWRKERSGGVTKKLVSTLGMICGMLDPFTGFVGSRLGFPGTRNDRFREALLSSGVVDPSYRKDDGSWDLTKWHADTRDFLMHEIIAHKHELSQRDYADIRLDFKAVRHWLMDRKTKPLKYLVDALKKMLAAIPNETLRTHHPLRYLNHMIDIMTWTAFLSWPGRAETWLAVTLDDIHELPDGEGYELVLPVKYFKNRAVLRKRGLEVVRVPISSPTFVAVYRTYLTEIRPRALKLLAKYDATWNGYRGFLLPGFPMCLSESEDVRPTDEAKAIAPKTEISGGTIYKRIRRLSKTYTGVAFGPHAFRAVYGTDMARRGKSVRQIAAILCDAEKTVQRHYQFALPSENMTHLNDLHHTVEVELAEDRAKKATPIWSKRAKLEKEENK